MTWQPDLMTFPDAELAVCTFLRSRIPGTYIGNQKPTTNRKLSVVVRRDGGSASGVLDRPRLGIRIWGDDEQAATNLALNVRAHLLDSPGSGAIVGATHLSGPSGIPDESQFQKYLTFELTLRAA